MDGRVVKKPYSDRRWYDELGGRRGICNFCKHKREFDYEKKVLPCDAFPEGIPREMLVLFKDTKDFSNECNNGIKFEVAKKYENKEWE